MFRPSGSSGFTSGRTPAVEQGRVAAPSVPTCLGRLMFRRRMCLGAAGADGRRVGFSIPGRRSRTGCLRLRAFHGLTAVAQRLVFLRPPSPGACENGLFEALSAKGGPPWARRKPRPCSQQPLPPCRSYRFWPERFSPQLFGCPRRLRQLRTKVLIWKLFDLALRYNSLLADDDPGLSGIKSAFWRENWSNRGETA